MIIHQPHKKLKSGKIIIFSNIEFKSNSISINGIPNQLQFSFPEEYDDYLSPNSDGFIASMVLLAMRYGEDIEVRGSTSAKLAEGIMKYQSVFNKWLPKLLTRVDVKFEKLVSPKKIKKSDNIGSAFSGGIDSFFTVFQNISKEDETRKFNLSHGLFIEGYDVSIRNQTHYIDLFERYRSVLKPLGIKLLTAYSNARIFYQHRLNWIYSHGGPLIGTSLVLGNLFDEFLIPSTYALENLHPLGTSPMTDHLLSTEKTQITHHGAESNRTIKMEKLASWVVTHENLRVCNNVSYRGEQMNCRKCDKCLSTIAYYEIINKLELFSVFPNKLSIKNFFRWFLIVDMSTRFSIKFVQRAKIENRWEIVLMMMAIFISARFRSFMTTLRDLIPLELKFWILNKIGK